jgi:hypothetical protein
MSKQRPLKTNVQTEEVRTPHTISKRYLTATHIVVLMAWACECVEHIGRRTRLEKGDR